MPGIVNNRIEGTRITVWDITHYLEHGRTPAEIAGILPITLEQAQDAIQYIDENKEEVWRVHRQIEERIARGNPPEIEAKIQESHVRLLAWLEENRKKNHEANGEGNHSGR
jgi:uncharacterized protein (DUF433 family)